jgi:hypothetical protein
MGMSTHAKLHLSSQQRMQLEKLIHAGTAQARTLTKARLLLLTDYSPGQHMTDADIAATLQVSMPTIGRIRQRCLADEIDAAIHDRTRPGKPPKITGEIEAKLIVLACSTPPEGRDRWTLRLLAEKLVELGALESISHVAVSKRLKKNALKPWQFKTWCIGTPSARFVAKMEDVLDVYHRPYNPDYPVICLDECSKVLHTTPRGALGAKPGVARREDYEYERQGTCNLFCWVEPLAGRRQIRVTARRTAIDLAEQLRLLVDEDYPDAKGIVLVTDNLNTHHLGALYEHFAPEEARRIAQRVEWHSTPEHASWLNMAEIELSVLAQQCLAGRIGDQESLARKVTAWQQERNKACAKIDWQFTTADARIKLRRLYPKLI